MTSGHSVPEQTGRRNIVLLVVVMKKKHTKGGVFELHHCERTPMLSTNVPAWWLLGLQKLSMEGHECSWRARTKSTQALENFQHEPGKCSYCQSFLLVTIPSPTWPITRQRPGCPIGLPFARCPSYFFVFRELLKYIVLEQVGDILVQQMMRAQEPWEVNFGARTLFCDNKWEKTNRILKGKKCCLQDCVSWHLVLAGIFGFSELFFNTLCPLMPWQASVMWDPGLLASSSGWPT